MKPYPWNIELHKVYNAKKNCYHLASAAKEFSIRNSCSDDLAQKGDKATTFPIIIRVGETRSADLTSSTRSCNIPNTCSTRNIQHRKSRVKHSFIVRHI
jgi:hypothetical protein